MIKLKAEMMSSCRSMTMMMIITMTKTMTISMTKDKDEDDVDNNDDDVDYDDDDEIDDADHYKSFLWQLDPLSNLKLSGNNFQQNEMRNDN